jgi:hypothetical protein
VLLLGGCSDDPPEIDAPHLSAADARACRALVAALPDTLAGEPRRDDVTGDTEFGAAWGDPAIVLTCGVGRTDLTDVPSCAEVNGVGWLVPPGEQEGGTDATFTADGYRPRVRLHVPEDYLPEGGAAALADLTAVMKAHTRLVERCS